MADDWKNALKRFDERTAKRRAKAQEQNDKAEALIREAEERRGSDKPAE